MRTNFTKGIWALVMSMAMFACTPEGPEGDGKEAQLEVNPTEVSFQFDGKTSEGAGNVVVDVVSSYIGLKRAGSNMHGLCPFHSEKTPSFTVFTATQGY